MDPKTPTFDVALKSTERQWVQKVPEVYTNDLHSVSLQFRITDCTDTELTGSTAIVLLKMRDGSFFQGPSVDVTRTLNVFSYTLKENEGNHDGLAEIQLIVTIGAKEFATQKYNFKVITGLDSEVAREIMIYDWSTLTREARAYIDEFTADELLRDAEFDNAQFDRNVAFNADQGQRNTDFELAQTQRNTDFGTDQAQRVSAFNASEAARVLAFNNAETARAAGYDADHSRAGTDHTGATTDRTNAATDRTNAATDRTNAAADRTLAGTDHTRAEADHTRADADSATVAGFNGRLVDVETDTSLDATNGVVNSDFRNNGASWGVGGATMAYSGNIAKVTADGAFNFPYIIQTMANTIIGRKHYTRFRVRVTNAVCSSINVRMPGYNSAFLGVLAPVQNQWYDLSFVKSAVDTSGSIVVYHNYNTGADAIGKIMEVQYPLSIDLTATFGAGNEPTVEQMDAIMAKFENSWFDGTKNLFQAKASLNKLMALDARTEFEAKNLVKNGDFTNGGPLTNFGTSNTMTVSDKLIVNGTADTYSGKYVDVATPTGNKLYISYLITNAGANKPNITISDYGTYNNQSWPTSIPGLRTSIISSKLNGIRIYIQQVTDVVYNNFTLDNMVVIDLTATFGAGKEPTLAEMDRLMTRFPNSWFDGVKPIQTIETLYQEKANKVQEAWITPTLLNGWTGNVKYAKNDLGQVTLKFNIIAGTTTIATKICSLTSGYRPIYIVGIRGNNPSSGPNCDLRLQPNGDLEIIVGVSTGNVVQGEIVFSTN